MTQSLQHSTTGAEVWTLFADAMVSSATTLNDSNHSSTMPPSPPPAIFLPCDNPRNLVSPEAADMIDLVVYVGLYPPVVLFGIVTNFVNMAVFLRQGLSDRINMYLFCLAVSDAGYLVFVMAGKSYGLITLVDPVTGDYWKKAHYGPILAMYLGFFAISSLITAIIALERCLCVLSPLKAAKFLKTRTMGIAIASSAVYILVVTTTCLGLKYETVRVVDPLTNRSTFVSHLTAVYQRHRTLLDVLYNHMLLITLPFVSLVVVIVCTTAIIVRLKVASAWRRGTTASDMTSSEKQELAVTRMLVTVCCVYVTCMTPSVSRGLALFGRVPGFLISGYLCNTFRTVVALNHFMEAVNASANFLMYVNQSSRYRATLRQLCPCRRGKGAGAGAGSVREPQKK